MRTAECQLQQCIHKIIHWANTNRFKISKNKTRCVHNNKIPFLHVLIDTNNDNINASVYKKIICNNSCILNYKIEWPH